jgi:hypothetical protein
MARLERPAFLLGCGRSGTTVLGQTLAEHRALHYLNEPRDLWTRAYPSCDVWSARAPRRGGRLALTATDVVWWRTSRLSGLFAESVARAGRQRLLEKLPVNAFRVPFLRALFPDALFVHLLRNGIEVARSIERECETGPWYGVNDYKWQQLVAQARQDPALAALPEACRTPYQRGLLEWRLAVEAALRSTEDLSSQQCLTVRYEELLARPGATIQCIEDFLGLSHDPATSAYAEDRIARRSAPAETIAVTEDTLDIAGSVLARLGYSPAVAPT